MIGFDLAPAFARSALRGLADLDALDDRAIVERFALVVWNALTEPGDAVAARLISALGAADALRLLAARRLPRPSGIGEKELEDGRRRWMPRLDPRPVLHALDLARAAGVVHLAPSDGAWPAGLADLGDNAPLSLWVRGDVGLLSRQAPSVALVGARAATSYGEHLSAMLAAELAGTGIPVVSGAAYGIDGAAHHAALHAGGATIALLAGGVERPYPAGHSDLIGRIATHGAVVSEVPCGSSPTKWRFLSRNRLIAALSDATVVVEAGWRSGSLNTAGHAAALGRPLGAVPGPVTSGASAGCHRLLREYGAECITSAADVRGMLNLDTLSDARLDVDPRPRTDDGTRVRDALSSRAWRSVEDLAARSGMAPEEVESHLGLLLLAGEVDREGRGWRRARS